MAKTSTALIVTAAAPETRHGRVAVCRRPLAPFLAHLIATAIDVPQTREKRRIAPEIAAGRYAAAPARPVTSRQSRSF